MIEIRDVTKSYQMGENRLEVLKGVSLRIGDGDFVAIMGPSGSGKSTLMNILGLLDVPTSGSYIFNNQEISHLNEDQLATLRCEEIGFIFQQFNLLPRKTAFENVSLPLLYSKNKERLSRGQALLKRLGLADRSHHRPNELSGGQQQRVAIARALINEPRLILADEPTGNLDTASSREIMETLRELNESGITVLMVTHEEEIAAYAKRLIRVRDGMIQSDERREAFKPIAPTKATSSAQPSSSPFDIFAYFKQGFLTLAANKIRTALSMLGILIGVGAVVAMLALGKGAQKAIQQQLSSLGSNLLVVRSGSIRIAGVTQESGTANRLNYEDAALLKNRIASIKEISAQINGRAQVTANAKNWNTFVQATSPSWAAVHSAAPEVGRYFTEEENSARALVVVIGETVRRELFGEQYPIGEMIKINKVNFQIIGVLPEKGAGGFRDQDDVVNIPVLSGMRRLLGREYVEMFETEIDKPENIESAVEAINRVLWDQHKISLSQQADAFQIRNMADIQAALTESNQTMSTLLASIAAISLLVGGIGIMNIMLVSVTERTREIGLLKAVGARKKDILSQFLSESVVISVVGGVIGILLGWLITVLMSAVAGWTTSMSPEAVLLAFFFSALIGIVFGIYPARKASGLNPIDALRHE